jgi:predicted ribonuclease YlaK
MYNEFRFPTDTYFYDTCSLLLGGEELFEQDTKPFLVSSITLKELERIKTASNKDADVKYSARLLLHLFEKYPDRYEVVPHKICYEKVILKKGFDITDDTRILSDAIARDKDEDIVFVTNDLSLKHIANQFLGHGMIESVNEDADNYTGYVEVILDDNELNDFYQKAENNFGLLPGQYLIIKDKDNKIVDLRVWTGDEFKYLVSKPIKSKWFGKIVPYQDDIYQKMLFDSLRNNKLTLVKGPAGSGKTYVSLAYLMAKLEAGELDKIIVFCNTIATANSAKLGYYPGTKDEKLLDSQIGNLLSSKFGGREAVEKMIADGKLVLLPFSDIRGYDTTGMSAGIYISEAQNLDRTLMKLALQRVGEDCICIIDGDEKTQVDDIHFSGANNGMKRVSKIFRGQDSYGEVTLKNIYRSKIAAIADKI